MRPHPYDLTGHGFRVPSCGRLSSDDVIGWQGSGTAIWWVARDGSGHVHWEAGYCFCAGWWLAFIVIYFGGHVYFCFINKGFVKNCLVFLFTFWLFWWMVTMYPILIHVGAFTFRKATPSTPTSNGPGLWVGGSCPHQHRDKLLFRGVPPLPLAKCPCLY